MVFLINIDNMIVSYTPSTASKRVLALPKKVSSMFVANSDLTTKNNNEKQTNIDNEKQTNIEKQTNTDNEKQTNTNLNLFDRFDRLFSGQSNSKHTQSNTHQDQPLRSSKRQRTNISSTNIKGKQSSEQTRVEKSTSTKVQSTRANATKVQSTRATTKLFVRVHLCNNVKESGLFQVSQLITFQDLLEFLCSKEGFRFSEAEQSPRFRRVFHSISRSAAKSFKSSIKFVEATKDFQNEFESLLQSYWPFAIEQKPPCVRDGHSFHQVSSKNQKRSHTDLGAPPASNATSLKLAIHPAYMSKESTKEGELFDLSVSVTGGRECFHRSWANPVRDRTGDSAHGSVTDQPTSLFSMHPSGLPLAGEFPFKPTLLPIMERSKNLFDVFPAQVIATASNDLTPVDLFLTVKCVKSASSQRAITALTSTQMNPLRPADTTLAVNRKTCRYLKQLVYPSPGAISASIPNETDDPSMVNDDGSDQDVGGSDHHHHVKRASGDSSSSDSLSEKTPSPRRSSGLQSIKFDSSWEFAKKSILNLFEAGLMPIVSGAPAPRPFVELDTREAREKLVTKLFGSSDAFPFPFESCDFQQPLLLVSSSNLHIFPWELLFDQPLIRFPSLYNIMLKPGAQQRSSRVPNSPRSRDAGLGSRKHSFITNDVTPPPSPRDLQHSNDGGTSPLLIHQRSSFGSQIAARMDTNSLEEAINWSKISVVPKCIAFHHSTLSKHEHFEECKGKQTLATHVLSQLNVSPNSTWRPHSGTGGLLSHSLSGQSIASASSRTRNASISIRDWTNLGLHSLRYRSHRNVPYHSPLVHVGSSSKKIKKYKHVHFIDLSMFERQKRTEYRTKLDPMTMFESALLSIVFEVEPTSQDKAAEGDDMTTVGGVVGNENASGSMVGNGSEMGVAQQLHAGNALSGWSDQTEFTTSVESHSGGFVGSTAAGAYHNPYEFPLIFFSFADLVDQSMLVHQLIQRKPNWTLVFVPEYRFKWVMTKISKLFELNERQRSKHANAPDLVNPMHKYFFLMTAIQSMQRENAIPIVTVNGPIPFNI